MKWLLFSLLLQRVHGNGEIATLIYSKDINCRGNELVRSFSGYCVPFNNRNGGQVTYFQFQCYHNLITMFEYANKNCDGDVLNSTNIAENIDENKCNQIDDNNNLDYKSIELLCGEISVQKARRYRNAFSTNKVALSHFSNADVTCAANPSIIELWTDDTCLEYPPVFYNMPHNSNAKNNDDKRYARFNKEFTEHSTSLYEQEMVSFQLYSSSNCKVNEIIVVPEHDDDMIGGPVRALLPLPLPLHLPLQYPSMGELPQQQRLLRGGASKVARNEINKNSNNDNNNNNNYDHSNHYDNNFHIDSNSMVRLDADDDVYNGNGNGNGDLGDGSNNDDILLIDIDSNMYQCHSTAHSLTQAVYADAKDATLSTSAPSSSLGFLSSVTSIWNQQYKLSSITSYYRLSTFYFIDFDSFSTVENKYYAGYYNGYLDEGYGMGWFRHSGGFFHHLFDVILVILGIVIFVSLICLLYMEYTLRYPKRIRPEGGVEFSSTHSRHGLLSSYQEEESGNRHRDSRSHDGDSDNGGGDSKEMSNYSAVGNSNNHNNLKLNQQKPSKRVEKISKVEEEVKLQPSIVYSISNRTDSSSVNANVISNNPFDYSLPSEDDEAADSDVEVNDSRLYTSTPGAHTSSSSSIGGSKMWYQTEAHAGVSLSEPSTPLQQNATNSNKDYKDYKDGDSKDHHNNNYESNDGGSYSNSNNSNNSNNNNHNSNNNSDEGSGDDNQEEDMEKVKGRGSASPQDTITI